MAEKLKELKDLTDKELLEDLGYYVKQAQYQSPSFTDNSYSAIWDDIKELFRRLPKDIEKISKDLQIILNQEPEGSKIFDEILDYVEKL